MTGNLQHGLFRGGQVCVKEGKKKIRFKEKDSGCKRKTLSQKLPQLHVYLKNRDPY